MPNIDKFYSIFQKDKLNESLSKVLSKKIDTSWIGLGMSTISSGITFLSNTEKIISAQNAQVAVNPLLLVGTVIIAIFFIVSLGWFLISITRWFSNRKYTIEDLKKDIYSAEVDHESNYVFIIKSTIENTSKFLFLKKEKWGYILPYIKSDCEIPSSDLETRLSEMLGVGITIKINILENMRLDDVIKKKPDEGYKKFSYKFCHCELSIDYYNFTKRLEDKYVFKSLDELRDDLTTMKSNSDVVNYMEEERTDFEDSFKNRIDSSLPNNIKVIWNLTDQCSFDCHFCATKRNTLLNDELNFDKRIHIAEELRKIDGLRLDFAGGDPLFDKESRKAIEHISKYMIKNNVTITSTGVGLSALKLEKLISYCQEFDISYDFPSDWSSTHRDGDYNKRNYAMMKAVIDAGAKVNVLVTLSDHNSGERIVDFMIRDLQKIRLNSITLLRLMPVGKQLYHQYPSKDIYDPSKAIKLFQQSFGKLIKLHCAFRASLDGESNYCNLLAEKIGLDNSGNIYACAWAGYLKDIPNLDNPFYLGNILDNGLSTIFRSQRYEEIRNNLRNSNRKFCKIFSYLEGGYEGMYENMDAHFRNYNIKP